MLLCRRYLNGETSHSSLLLVDNCVLRPSLHGLRVERASPAAHSIPSHLRYQICSRIKVELHAWHLRLLLWSILSGIWNDIRAAVCIRTTTLLGISLFLHLAPLVPSTMLILQLLVTISSVVIYRKIFRQRCNVTPNPSKSERAYLSSKVHAGNLHSSNDNIATPHYCDAPYPTLWRLAQHP